MVCIDLDNMNDEGPIELVKDDGFGDYEVDKYLGDEGMVVVKV